MQVVALRTGYHESLRLEGDIFDVPAGVTGSWFLPTGIEQSARKATEVPVTPEPQEVQEPQENQDETGAADEGSKPRKKKAGASA